MPRYAFVAWLGEVAVSEVDGSINRADTICIVLFCFVDGRACVILEFASMF